MSYAVELTPRARDLLRKLPIDLAEAVLDHIDMLALDPTGLSLPSDENEPYQFHRFHWEGRQGPTRVTIPFQYSQDEQTLIIIQIAVAEL
jgi:mRNA-degrading endonuclease RelE of RelBE toxin-antitoxin system